MIRRIVMFDVAAAIEVCGAIECLAAALRSVHPRKGAELRTKRPVACIIFKIDGVSEPVAKEALHLAAMTLPVKCSFVVRQSW